MWAVIFLCSLVGHSTVHGWGSGQEYQYNIEARTVAGMHQMANQYVGTLVRGKLKVYANTENQLTLRIHGAQYADINQNLIDGWATPINEGQATFKTFPIRNSSFQVYLKNGVFQHMIVDKDLSQWELNFLKGITSQFQVNAEAKNITHSKLNDPPYGNRVTGVFATMEESINGKYETIYEISELPNYLLASRPQLAPLEYLRGDEEIYRIFKTRNFSNSDQHIVYRYGMSGHEGWEAGTNTMGNVLARNSESEITISGKPGTHTIQSTVTTEKVLVAPHLYGSQKGIVAGRMNLTLEAVNFSAVAIPMINNSRMIPSLVYEFEHKVSETQWPSKPFEPVPSFVGTSDSISSSSAENTNRLKRQINSDVMTERQIRHSPMSSSEWASIGSSEEYLSPPPEFDETSIEFLPDHAHNNHNNTESVEKIVQLARRIGRLLKNPSDIPSNHVLALYAILTRLTGSVKPKQLQEATELLHYSEKSSNESGKGAKQEDYWSWQVFRDAVVQSGSGPALVEIGSWIKSGRVKGNEGAQVLAALPQASRYPTTEYMNYFFSLVKNREVKNKTYLNDSIVLSFADLIRRSQVDREIARHRYPVNLSANSENHWAVVASKYIPYFQLQLEEAIAQGDSAKIQVYIHAIANTAHPKVFSVFEPYLEGKRQISKFQRFLMIATLDEIAKVHPNTARSLLYRTYQNQGEAPEVRVAAVMQLMKTNPSAQLLQKMAERTNYDHSKQVSAAVKSSIESLARAQYHPNSYLVENAKSAVNFLTPENYGAQYSKNFILSYLVKEQVNLQYQMYLSSVQANYGAFPNGLVYNIDRNIGGYMTEPFKLSYLSSGSEQLLNLLTKQIRKTFHQPVNHKARSHPRNSTDGYTYQSISKLIDWEDDDQPQVEGNFFMTLLGGQRLFTFDNYTIEQLPNMIREFNKNLTKGINLQMAKFYNLYSMEVGFPLVTGVPFTYSLNVPTLSYLKVKGSGHFKKELEEYSTAQFLPLNAGINGEYEIIFSSQRRGKMGFVALHSNQRYLASVEKQTQFYIPLRGKIEINGTNNHFHAALRPAGDSLLKLFQYNTSAYTTYQNISDNTPYLQGRNVRLISVGPKKNFHASFGKQFSGYTFKVDINSEGDFHDSANVYNAFYKNNHDLISFLLYNDLETVIVNNNFVFMYDPKIESPKDTTIAITYVQKTAGSTNHKEKINSINKAQPISVKERKRELLKNVDINISDAHSWLFDTSISFGGSKNGLHVLTIAHSESPVSKKSRYLLYYFGTPPSENPKVMQAAVEINIKKPQLPLVNFLNALNTDATMYIEGKINFNESEHSKIEFQGKLQKTAERKEYLRAHPLTAICEKQMARGDNIQLACLNLTESANYLDKYDFHFSYQNVPKTVKYAGYTLYGMIRHFCSQYNNESIIKGEEGKLAVGIKFTEDLQKVNVSMRSSVLQSNFNNVQINYWIHPLLVQHPRSRQVDMFARKFIYSEIYPTCSMDPKRISTFNHRSYPANLGNCFHVMAMSVPKDVNDTSEEFLHNTNNFTVLVKDFESQKKMVQVLLGDDIVTLKPSEERLVSISANNVTIQFSESKLTRWKNGLNEFAVHSLPGDYVVLYSSSHDLQLIYDGQRVQLAISTHYRNKVRGLCGTFDGEQVNDFTTASNCILKDHKLFTASYAVPDDTCQGTDQQLHIDAKDVPCYPKKTLLVDLVTDAEILQLNPNGSERHRSEKAISCASYGVKIVKFDKKTCFSIRSQLSCSSKCKPANTIEKTVSFYCQADSVATKHWVDMIHKGLHPDFSQKGANHKMKIPLPDNCVHP